MPFPPPDNLVISTGAGSLIARAVERPRILFMPQPRHREDLRHPLLSFRRKAAFALPLTLRHSGRLTLHPTTKARHPERSEGPLSLSLLLARLEVYPLLSFQKGICVRSAPSCMCHNDRVTPEDTFEKLIESNPSILAYFDQQVLASYRNNPHKYELESDSFEGTLTLTKAYFQELEEGGNTDEWLSLKFGYRTLADGELAVTLWVPDLMKAKMHQAKWMGFYLENPVWTFPDERFEQWAKRYIGGSWDIDNGPKFKLAELVNVISGFTTETVGHRLYKHTVDSSLTFPAGENTHRYQDAHARLYGFLIDGLNKQCIKALAKKLGKSMNFENDNTRKALERIFPELLAPSAFSDAMDLVSEQRRLADHGVRPRAERQAAFSTFTQDLRLCLKALEEVFKCLEKHLGVDGVSASKKNEARKWLPLIRDTQFAQASIHKSTNLVGKTVERVEYGDRETMDGVHESEAVILHFTDGSIMAFDTGSNAYNITSDRVDLKPEDFHVSMHLTWVPPIKPK